MAFKRYDGFTYSALQRFIDKSLPICPFCRANPHWLIEIQTGVVKNTVRYQCERCGATMEVKSALPTTEKDLNVVTCGGVNANNLQAGQFYHVYALAEAAAKSTTNQAQSPFYENNDQEINPQTPTQQSVVPTSANTHKRRATTIIIISSVIAFILTLVLSMWIFGVFDGRNPTAKDIELVEQPNITVEEVLPGYYSVTITGSCKNTSKKNVDHISITFTLYDASGAVVGTAIDNQLDVGAGETWRYTAIGTTTSGIPISWRLTDLQVTSD